MDKMQTLKSLSESIKAVEAQRVSGEVKPVPAGRQREAFVCLGVFTLAESMGVTLKPIPCFTSFGELEIASVDGKVFSKEFCDALNTHCKPRCGIFPTAVMEPEHSNWCRINHFDAERMIHAIADTTA